MKLIYTSITSLRYKRFRGVGEQRKTEERDFRCFSRTKDGARAKTLKILFLGLSLLFNPLETLATQTSRSRIISSVQSTVFLVCLGRNFLSKPLTHLCFSLPIQGPLVISWFALWCIRTKECRQPWTCFLWIWQCGIFVCAYSTFRSHWFTIS